MGLQKSGKKPGIADLGFAARFTGAGMIMLVLGLLTFVGSITPSLNLPVPDNILGLLIAIFGAVLVYWGVGYWQKAV